MLEAGAYYLNEENPLEFEVAEITDHRFLELLLDHYGTHLVQNLEGSILHVLVEV